VGLGGIEPRLFGTLAASPPSGELSFARNPQITHAFNYTIKKISVAYEDHDSASPEDAHNRLLGWTPGSVFLLFKTSQNAAFSLPFHDIGLFLRADPGSS
jgi:hypothetical protein